MSKTLTSNLVWSPLFGDFVKVNFDGAFCGAFSKIGFRAIARGNVGEFLQAKACSLITGSALKEVRA